MSLKDNRELIIGIMLVCGIIIMADFVIDIEPLNNIASILRTSTVIISATAMGLAAVNIIRINLVRGLRETSVSLDKFFNIWTVLLMIATIALGLMGPSIGGSEGFLWIYKNINQPIHASVYSLTVFYIFYAAWRAFRIRSIESSILLVAGILIMFSNIPLGAFIPGLNEVGTWVFKVPSAAGSRALEIAISFGIVVMGYRTLIGREKSMPIGSEIKEEG